MAQAQTTPVLLKADYWRTEDDRVETGQIIDVPIPEALKLIEEGKATRADPMGR